MCCIESLNDFSSHLSLGFQLFQSMLLPIILVSYNHITSFEKYFINHVCVNLLTGTKLVFSLSLYYRPDLAANPITASSDPHDSLVREVLYSLHSTEAQKDSLTWLGNKDS